MCVCECVCASEGEKKLALIYINRKEEKNAGEITRERKSKKRALCISFLAYFFFDFREEAT